MDRFTPHPQEEPDDGLVLPDIGRMINQGLPPEPEPDLPRGSRILKSERDPMYVYCEELSPELLARMLQSLGADLDAALVKEIYRAVHQGTTLDLQEWGRTFSPSRSLMLIRQQALCADPEDEIVADPKDCLQWELWPFARDRVGLEQELDVNPEQDLLRALKVSLSPSAIEGSGNCAVRFGWEAVNYDHLLRWQVLDTMLQAIGVDPLGKNVSEHLLNPRPQLSGAGGIPFGVGPFQIYTDKAFSADAEELAPEDLNDRESPSLADLAQALDSTTSSAGNTEPEVEEEAVELHSLKRTILVEQPSAERLATLCLLAGIELPEEFFDALITAATTNAPVDLSVLPILAKHRKQMFLEASTRHAFGNSEALKLDTDITLEDEECRCGSFELWLGYTKEAGDIAPELEATLSWYTMDDRIQNLPWNQLLRVPGVVEISEDCDSED